MTPMIRYFTALAERAVHLTILVPGGALVLLLAATAHSVEPVHQDNWIVHHTVLPTTALQADIARQYGIQRAGDRAFLNLSVVDSGAEGIGATPAVVSGRFTNLLGQTETLSFREVREGDALYYIAEFRFPHRERLRFELTVAPEGAGRPITLDFRQEIYQEDRP